MSHRTFADRLSYCAAKVGGKKALAEKAAVSESHLFRYLRDEATPTLNKMEDIAAAAEVNLGWLTSGAGEAEGAHHRTYDPELYERLIVTFERTLQEFQGSFTPEQKGALLPLIYQAARHEQDHNGSRDYTDKIIMLALLYTLHGQEAESLKLLRRGFDELAAIGLEAQVTDTLLLFCRKINRLGKHYYDAKTGEMYYERVGGVLNAYHCQLVQDLMKFTFDQVGQNAELKILDVGCGNGRHLKYLAEHYPQIAYMQGVDYSDLAIKLAQKQEKAGRVPLNTFQQVDAFQLPYPDASFNVIMCRSMLHCFPFVPNIKEFGATALVAEMARVLAPGGVMYLEEPYGQGYRHLHFIQMYDEQAMQNLALPHNLHIHRLEKKNIVPEDANGSTEYVDSIPKPHDVSMRAWLVKAG